MKIIHKDIHISTKNRNQMIDITGQIADVIAKSGIQNGLATLYCPHTTAAVTINENADPDVPHDILLVLEKLVPQHLAGYQHGEGNSDAHIKSSIIGCSRQIFVRDGELVLGTWQGIFFCEFDGPRSRTLHIQISGE